MKNVKVKFKMLILLICVVVMAIFNLMIARYCLRTMKENALDQLEQQIRDDYDTNIKEEVQNAYEIMEEGSTTIYKLEATPYSSSRVVFVDKFGIRWGIMTEQTER